MYDDNYYGPFPLKPAISNPAKDMKKILERVAEGEFDVPERMRTFVRDFLKGLKNDASANDPFIRQHPFLRG